MKRRKPWPDRPHWFTLLCVIGVKCCHIVLLFALFRGADEQPVNISTKHGYHPDCKQIHKKLPCCSAKPKRQYLLTCKVSRYSLLALHTKKQGDNWFFSDLMLGQHDIHWTNCKPALVRNLVFRSTDHVRIPWVTTSVLLTHMNLLTAWSHRPALICHECIFSGLAPHTYTFYESRWFFYDRISSI